MTLVIDFDPDPENIRISLLTIRNSCAGDVLLDKCADTALRAEGWEKFIAQASKTI